MARALADELADAIISKLCDRVSLQLTTDFDEIGGSDEQANATGHEMPIEEISIR